MDGDWYSPRHPAAPDRHAAPPRHQATIRNSLPAHPRKVIKGGSIFARPTIVAAIGPRPGIRSHRYRHLHIGFRCILRPPNEQSAQKTVTPAPPPSPCLSSVMAGEGRAVPTLSPPHRAARSLHAPQATAPRPSRICRPPRRCL